MSNWLDSKQDIKVQHLHFELLRQADPASQQPAHELGKTANTVQPMGISKPLQVVEQCGRAADVSNEPSFDRGAS